MLLYTYLKNSTSLYIKNKKIEDDVFLGTINKYYKLDKITNVEVFTGKKHFKCKKCKKRNQKTI